MKNILRTLILCSFITFLFVSCEEEKSLYDGPALVHFDNSSGAFYVQDVENASYEIFVGGTTISNSDRTITIEIDESSSAIEGESFNIVSKTVTIPAGQSYGVLKIDGIYAGTSPTGDTLTLNISSTSDGAIADFKSTYQLLIYQFCPFDIYEFEGIWEVNDFSLYDGAYDPYEISLEVSDEATKTMVATGLWGETIPVYITMNDSDPANFVCRILDQYYATHPNYGQMRIVDLVPGTFSACSKTINTSYKVYVSAGNFDAVNPSTWTYVGPFPTK